MKEKVLRKKKEKDTALSAQVHTSICKKKITGTCCICKNKICGDCGIACKEETCFLVYCLKHLDQLDRCDHFIPEIKEDEEEKEKDIDLSHASKSEIKKKIINVNEEGPIEKYFSNLSGNLTIIGNINIDKDGKIGTDLEFEIKQNGNDLEISQIDLDNISQNFTSVVTNSFGGFNQVNRFFNGGNNSAMCINGMTVTSKDLDMLREIKKGNDPFSKKKEEEKKVKKTFYLKDCKFKKISLPRVGNVYISKLFIGSVLEIFIKGSGGLHLSDSIFKIMNVHISGSGDVEITDSKISHMECNVHGSGDIIGNNTFVDVFLGSVHGSGDIEGFVVEKDVKASLYGSGDISLRKKSPNVTVNKEKYGSGSIRIK